MRVLFVSFLFLTQSILFGQKTILMGGNIHTASGVKIESGFLVFENDRIVYLGQNMPDTLGCKVINVQGKEIYPTFILPVSTIGLKETESVRATLDFNEVGQLNPNTRTQIAYNTDSELIPTIRANGIGLAQIIPRGGLLAGQSTVMKLSAWNWEDATVLKDDGMHLFWPSILNSFGWWEDAASQANENRNKQIEILNKLFTDAITYSKTSNSTKNLKLEALINMLKGTQTLYIHADHSSEIIEALGFCTKYGIKKKVIVGAENSQKAISMLLETQTPVIFTRTHSLPPMQHQAIDHPYRLCVEMIRKGLTVGLSYLGDMEVMGCRNFPFTAGSLTAYGLTKEEALSLISLNVAKILGLEKDWGSLEVGKKASFFVSSGDALDIKTNNVELLFIEGKNVDLETKHTQLFKKYSQKYGIE
ncbi:MAG: amidohydrolase family protein [Cytophagales bacterium]